MSLAPNPEAATQEPRSPLSGLSLTIVVPVKNEAHNLPACLASIEGVPHLLVVDSGSTDATLDLARAAGAEILQFKWPGGFPKKRNWVLETYQFKTDWVLFLDGDERLTPAFKRDLAPALARTDVVGFWLNYHNHFMGKVLRHGVPQRKLALFRVGAGFYERIEDPGWSTMDMEVHEHPVLDGATAEIAGAIDHQDFRGLHHFIARHNEYSSWEARRFLAMRADADAWAGLTPRQRLKYDNLTRWWFAAVYFLYAYAVRGGWRTGVGGRGERHEGPSA